MTPLLKAALRPLRRFAATLVLVDEERSLRHQQVDPLVERVFLLERAQERLEQQLAGAQQRADEAASLVGTVEDRATRRMELVVSEVMHRAEAADARLTTDLQRALDVLARQQRDVAALTRSLAGPEPLGELARAAAMEAAPDSSAYRLFQELERGSRQQVAEQVAAYVPLFEGVEPVVDLGCGRGEFLELATAAGLPVYGVDSDPEAVAGCRRLGLKVEEQDALEHLAGLADASVGGVMCTHLVEHLPQQGLWPFVAQLERVLVSGGVAVVETPNPSTLATHLGSFWRDPTHVRPVPAPALWFAARRAGLVVADTLYGHLPEQRLERSGPAGAADPQLRALAERYDALVERLNDLLLGPQDYAVVLRKP